MLRRGIPPGLLLRLVAIAVVVLAIVSASGSVVMCRDGSVSFSGGRPGACSGHGGVLR